MTTLTVALDLDSKQSSQVSKLTLQPGEASILTLTLEFQISGGFYSGSSYEPPEYPDFEILEYLSGSVEFDSGLELKLSPYQLEQVVELLTRDDLSTIETLAFEFVEADSDF